jgi:DNA-binding response OmpR family regulator
VVKPFSLKELAARCRVALRRTGSGGGDAPQGYRDENFEVEFDSFIVRCQSCLKPRAASGETEVADAALRKHLDPWSEVAESG